MGRLESSAKHGTRGVLVVPVGEVLFGARVEDVAGLIEADRLAPLPHQRTPIAGIVAFRGDMVPALDFCAYLDAGPGLCGVSRYAVVLTRGADRFALLVPAMPRLVPGRELREGTQAFGDSELKDLIDCVYETGGAPIHCLRYWSIFDSVIPPNGVTRRAGDEQQREVGHV
ncbi:MAG: chemotaxis protein CheW [Hyphomicrobiales bacterium]